MKYIFIEKKGMILVFKENCNSIKINDKIIFKEKDTENKNKFFSIIKKIKKFFDKIIIKNQ